MYYAQIKDCIVCAVTQTAGPIVAADMIPIDGLLDICGYTYADGQFTAPVVSPIPVSVTALQGMLALDAAGLSSQYDAWATSPDRTFAQRAFIDKAQRWRRDDPTLQAAATAFGLTSENLDQLFVVAAGL